MRKWINEDYLTPIFETNTSYSEWFGYYNYDVISRDGKKMLCNRADFDGRSITDQDTIELGWYDIFTKTWHHIDQTDSFNWQQGAMLQWLPGEGNEDKVIYNISKNGHFKSVIYNTKDGNKKIIDFPTYCVMPDGQSSISLNYERSYWCRAYHYQTVKNPKYDVQVAEDDGIFKVDFETNTVIRIVKIQDVIRIDPLEDFDKAKHWLEHIMLNKSGTRIAFLHRFTYVKGYTTRVCICNIDGSNLQVLPDWRHNFWSHLGWKGDNSFALYTVRRESITESMKEENHQNVSSISIKRCFISTVKKIMPASIKEKLRKTQESYYQLYTYKDNKMQLVNIYNDPLFSIDGHPSFTNDECYMFTDSYPDNKHMQKLIVFNTDRLKAKLIGLFFATFQGNPASCDLHPKLSWNDQYLVVDTDYSGKHRMCVFQINWEAIRRDMEK